MPKSSLAAGHLKRKREHEEGTSEKRHVKHKAVKRQQEAGKGGEVFWADQQLPRVKEKEILGILKIPSLVIV